MYNPHYFYLILLYGKFLSLECEEIGHFDLMFNCNNLFFKLLMM